MSCSRTLSCGWIFKAFLLSRAFTPLDDVAQQPHGRLLGPRPLGDQDAAALLDDRRRLVRGDSIIGEDPLQNGLEPIQGLADVGTGPIHIADESRLSKL